MSKRESAARSGESSTVRAKLRGELLPGFASAKQLSMRLGVPERDIAQHLLHLDKSIRRDGERLEVAPATCLSCGFVFRKRDRLTRPTGCPMCRGERIDAPRFRVVTAQVKPRRSRHDVMPDHDLDL